MSPCPPAPRAPTPPQARAPCSRPRDCFLWASRAKTCTAAPAPLQRRTASISLPVGPQNYHKAGKGAGTTAASALTWQTGARQNLELLHLRVVRLEAALGVRARPHRGPSSQPCGCSRGSSSLGARRPTGGKTHFRWTPRGLACLPPGQVGATGQAGTQRTQGGKSPAEPTCLCRAREPATISLTPDQAQWQWQACGGWVRPPAQPLWRAHSAAPAAELSTDAQLV